MTIATLLLFTIQNLALVVSAAILATAIKKTAATGSLKKTLLITTFYFSEIILIEISLGIFGAINAKNILFASIALPIILAAIFYKKIRLKIKEALKENSSRAKRRTPLFAVIAIFTPITVLLFIRLFNAMLQIPLEYDSVSYHLPFIAKWLQTGNLATPYFTAFSSPLGYYPSNYELLDLWTAVPFNSDYFFHLLNFPLLILLALAVYGICRNFKISRKIGVISTGLIFYMPIFLKQAGTPLVDLFFTLTFVLTIYFLQEILKNKNEPLDFLAFGLCVGLFIGTKYLGLPYATIPILLLLILSCAPSQRKGKLKGLLIIIIGIFLTGSFFYLRNWLTTGNPIFPVEISLFGKQIFEGYQNVNQFIDSSALIRHLNNLPELKKFTSLLYQQVGPQIFAIFLALILNFSILIYEIFRKNFRLIATPAILLIANLIYFLLYLKAPYTYQQEFENIRYAMPFFILGCINIAWVANYFKKLKYFFYFGAFAITSYALTHIIHLDPPEIKLTSTYQIQLVLFAIAALAFLYAVRPKNHKHKTLQIFLTLISFTIGLDLTSKAILFTAYEREKLIPHFSETLYAKDPRVNNIIKANDWIEKNAPNAKIAYAGFNFHYHFFGRNFQREVDYININDCRDCDYYNYRNTQGGIRSNPSYENWLQNLAAKEKEYLIIDTKFTSNVKSYELDWAKQNSGKFKQVFNLDNTYIYKIVR